MPDHRHFPHLFSKLKIKDVTLRNRIAISGHFAGWWVGPGGLPSDAFVAYVEERAKGGVGLFVIGATSPEPGSGWMENLDDRIVPRYTALTEAGHRHGTAVFAQLCHPGFRPLPGIPIIEPSPSVDPPSSQRPRIIPTVDRLQTLIRAFGSAAGRAAKGGVDGVELHSHESFLHAQMLNPYWNQRMDEYGGSLENRMRFLLETLTAMRKAIGPKLPLGVRLKIDDMIQRGMGPEDYRECVRRLEATGLIDYVIFTGGDGRFHHGPMPRPDGEWLDLVHKMRAATKLVIMHAGRITTAEMAEKALAQGWLDMVCMTKTHIADPHFAVKVYEGRMEDIRYCTRCLQACHGHMREMGCVYNPLTRREKEWSTLEPAKNPRRVVVVGAGPAGMEFALTAAQRGHRVTVLERSSRIGGQVLVGASSPNRRLWGRIAEFYDRQSKKGLFEVRLRTEADEKSILAQNPDIVVIATGSQPKQMEIAGGPRAWTVHELVGGKTGSHGMVVVYDAEGSNRAIVAVDLLSSKGVDVEFVTPHARIGQSVESMTLDEMVHRLRDKGVRFRPGTSIVRWDGPNRLRVKADRSGEESVLMADAVIALAGSASVNSLADSLKGRVSDLHVIGDAKEPRGVEDATYEGARLARML